MSRTLGSMDLVIAVEEQINPSAGSSNMRTTPKRACCRFCPSQYMTCSKCYKLLCKGHVVVAVTAKTNTIFRSYTVFGPCQLELPVFVYFYIQVNTILGVQYRLSRRSQIFPTIQGTLLSILDILM